MEQLK